MLVRMCFPTDSLARQSDAWYRSECHQNQSPVDQRGDGIPPLAAIHPTWRDSLIFCGLLFHLRDNARKGLFFSQRIVTVNPHDTESANISGKLRRKGTGRGFFPLPFLHPYPSLPLICGGEPMVHYNWSLSSCR